MNDRELFRYKIILTGGGTGGHIMPLVAVAEELKDYPSDVVYIGEKGGREEKIAKQNGLTFKGIVAGKWRRYYTLNSIGENLIDLMKIKIGFWQALVYLIKFRPHVIFSKGGYVSLPVIFAGFVLRIPIFVHESDMVMGVSNRIGYKLAKKVGQGFPINNFKDNGKMVYTGTPVQKIFNDNKLKPNDFTLFGFDRELPIVLITGGIQGAHIINEIIKNSLEKFVKKWQIIHLSGEDDFKELERARENLKNNKKRYIVFPFLGNERVAAMRVSDLVVSRASATTLAELAIIGKPAILIPLKGAANNHQEKNAEVFFASGAAEIIDEDKLTNDRLYETIECLLKDKVRLEKSKYAMIKLANFTSAKNITEEIFKLIRE